MNLKNVCVSVSIYACTSQEIRLKKVHQFGLNLAGRRTKENGYTNKNVFGGSYKKSTEKRKNLQMYRRTYNMEVSNCSLLCRHLELALFHFY